MRVHFYATLREIVGGKYIDLDLADGTSVQRLLDRVLSDHPGLRGVMLDEAGLLSQHVHLFVNGRGCVFLERGLDTPLSARHDRVDFFPAVAGGEARESQAPSVCSPAPHRRSNLAPGSTPPTSSRVRTRALSNPPGWRVLW